MPTPKVYTITQAVLKAQSYCAYQERCQQEVYDKVTEWGMYPNEANEVITLLIADGFLNEARFALLYVSGKTRIKRWGRKKIIQGLKFKRISDRCIKDALLTIDDEEYTQNIMYHIRRKIGEQPLTTLNYLLLQKAIQHTLTKGFEYDIILDVIKEEKDKE
ncbi:MAG: RecX family transcriptional regulator [Bacteroidia bacterium]|nr:RecX family transcriptional regulator [Bacteroidia bacterium]